MMTDPIADMLTRVRNANRIERPAVDMPATALKRSVAHVLKEEGFILDYQVGVFEEGAQGHPEFQTRPDAKGGPVQPSQPGGGLTNNPMKRVQGRGQQVSPIGLAHDLGQRAVEVTRHQESGRVDRTQQAFYERGDETFTDP